MAAVLGLKRDRHGAIRRLVAERPIGSQGELVEALSALGFEVTQATVSRDIAELGLAKVMRGDHAAYVNPEALGRDARPPSDERLRRILADIPVTVGRSGLILVLTGQPGTASVIGQAIDESTLTDQVGTVAGDNTLIVLFPDEPALERWLARFESIQAPAEPALAHTEALAR
jgi:transcriptional regulator of arginine metabolism